MEKTILKKLAVPSLLALCGLSILISLGTWQLKRHNWKTDLLSQIKVGISSIPQEYILWKVTRKKDLKQFAHIKITGQFLPQKTLYVHSIRKGILGYLIFTPFMYETKTRSMIFVNRGFVPSHLKEQISQNLQNDTKETEVSGLIRLPEKKNVFTPEANKSKKIWYIADIKDMARALSDLKLQDKHYIEIINNNSDAIWPKTRTSQFLLKSIPNRHFEYALTWFGLSGALIIVFILFVRATIKEPES